MGIWTAVVCATALSAAADSEKTRFDFDGPTGAVTLASPGGTLVDGGKTRQTRGELSAQVQDRVSGQDATYGDTAELLARFSARGKDVEVRLTKAGFPPGSGGEQGQRPEGKVQGGVALKVSESDEGGPSRLSLWGTAEVLVDGKSVTDQAVVSMEATEDRRSTVALKISGLPKSVSTSGEWRLRFGDAVVMVDAMTEENTPEGALPVLELEQVPPAREGVATAERGPAQSGTGGAGTEGTGQAAQQPQEGAQQGYGAQGTSSQGTAAVQPQVAAPASTNVTGLPTAGPEQPGIGGAGQEGLGVQPAAQPAAPAPLTGIDYGTSTSALGPIFPGSAPPAPQQAGQIGYPALGGAPLPQTPQTTDTSAAAQVGTLGAPGSTSVSPGSPTGLSGISGTQVSPGIPASPPVLNNGAFPPALQGGNTTTPGVPASNPVLNNGQSLVGQPATPNRVTGTDTTGATPPATGGRSTGTGTGTGGQSTGSGQ